MAENTSNYLGDVPVTVPTWVLEAVIEAAEGHGLQGWRSYLREVDTPDASDVELSLKVARAHDAVDRARQSLG